LVDLGGVEGDEVEAIIDRSLRKATMRRTY
jgi:hypothetical protein